MRFSISLSRCWCVVISLCVLGLNGCTDPNNPPVAQKQEQKQGPVFNKFTQDVGEYNPNDTSVEVSDGKMKTPSPLNPLGALSAYGPIMESVSGMKIKQAVEMFRATTGRYPKDHLEFTEKVIMEFEIKLPVLPGGATYRYDVANHELVVVRPRKD